MSEAMYSGWEPIQQKNQTDAGVIKSFGIEIMSRYSNAVELSEMLCFTHMAKLLNVNGFVEMLFYDGQSNTCSISLINGISFHPVILHKIHLCAKKTISQFEWDGYAEHRVTDADIELDNLRGMVGFLCFHANRLSDCCDVLAVDGLEHNERNKVLKSIENNVEVLDRNIEYCLDYIPKEFIFSADQESGNEIEILNLNQDIH